jgi:hypothetical protein
MYKTQLKIDWTATKLKAADGKLLVKYTATLDIPWKCWGKVWQDQKWTIMKWNAGRCKQWCIYHPQCYRIVGEENDLLRAKNMVAHMIEVYVKHGGWPLTCQFAASSVFGPTSSIARIAWGRGRTTKSNISERSMPTRTTAFFLAAEPRDLETVKAYWQKKQQRKQGE